jgi:hypothetical protein
VAVQARVLVAGAWLERSGVAGDTGVGGALVSRDCYTLGVLGASLFYYYDSLIEKCSTLSVVRASADRGSAFYSLSLASERSEVTDVH